MVVWIPLSTWLGWTSEQQTEVQRYYDNLGAKWAIEIDNKFCPQRNSEVADVEEYQGEERDIGIKSR